MGYLKRIADKKYRLIYDLPKSDRRRQKTETLVGVTKAEAEAYLAARKDEARRGQAEAPKSPTRVSKVTVAVVFAKFIESKQMVADLSPKTLERYEQVYRSYIHPSFGTLLVSDIQPSDLISAYARWRKRGVGGHQLSRRSIRHIHDLIRTMLHYAVRMGFADRNIATQVAGELPKMPKPRPESLKVDDLKKLLACAESPTPWALKHGVISAQPWFAAAVVFAVSTGARRGEVLALRWSDVDLDRRIAKIHLSLCETKMGLQFKATKTEEPRTIMLPHTLVERLRRHRACQDEERRTFGSSYQDNNLVFAMPNGKPVVPWTFTSSFRHLVKRAAVPRIRLHGLRDTHATLLRDHAARIEVISKRLGHSDIRVTVNRYVKVDLDADAEVADVFDRLVS